MDDPTITFFMIVTDRDCLIADYAIRSYGKITDVNFRLVVYSNWLRAELRARYFPEWQCLPFVDIWCNPAHTDEHKPQDPSLEGPYEYCDPIWDRELKRLADARYYATVDADFEILDPRFITVMLQRLEAEPELVAMSTDYSPRQPMVYESYSGEIISLNERWHTWFCIYKRAALECHVSHAYHEEVQMGSARRDAWDSAAFFQKALREQCGYRLSVLDRRHRMCFIHYGAFSKNRHIDHHNVGLYRRIQILKRVGLFGHGDPFTRAFAVCINRALFGRVERSTYVPGWGRPQ
jgi:hypothetical protein